MVEWREFGAGPSYNVAFHAKVGEQITVVASGSSTYIDMMSCDELFIRDEGEVEELAEALKVGLKIQAALKRGDVEGARREAGLPFEGGEDER